MQLLNKKYTEIIIFLGGVVIGNGDGSYDLQYCSMAK